MSDRKHKHQKYEYEHEHNHENTAHKVWVELTDAVIAQFVNYLFTECKSHTLHEKDAKLKCRRCKLLLKASKTLDLEQTWVIKVIYSPYDLLLVLIDYTDQTLESIKEEPWLSIIASKAMETNARLSDLDDDCVPNKKQTREYIIDCSPPVDIDCEQDRDFEIELDEHDNIEEIIPQRKTIRAKKCGDVFKLEERPYSPQCPKPKCVKKKQFCLKETSVWNVKKHPCKQVYEKEQHVVRNVKKRTLRPIKCENIITVEYPIEQKSCYNRCYDEIDVCCESKKKHSLRKK